VEYGRRPARSGVWKQAHGDAGKGLRGAVAQRGCTGGEGNGHMGWGAGLVGRSVGLVFLGELFRAGGRLVERRTQSVNGVSLDVGSQMPYRLIQWLDGGS
jgi:hypothetical protein